MTISLKTQKMLWGKAAGRCSRADCRRVLFEDETTADDASLVGENCHIVAESDDGPRADPTMPIERRNSYSNLILLCRIHHKVIDDQESTYTVASLHEMKDQHEAWVRDQLGFDQAKQFQDEQYAGIVDEWERLAHTENWLGWASYVLSNDQPRMTVEIDSDLEKLRQWLLTRVWPEGDAGLESAFQNFRRVLSDFQESFRKHVERTSGGDWLFTIKFYQNPVWDTERYERMLKKYEFHVSLVQDLMLELTRAANLIADRIRQTLMRTYRLKEGRFAVEYGPLEGFQFRTVIVQYGSEERKEKMPYPGLAEFLTKRANRDVHFGEGTEP
ncbi:HNH endonuclease [Bradyrhizobium sp. UNPF46]|uniref:HNH endonuclease n=1 Tax=Bradyrhizobium sp. UNPF46 TaxID=1141168 RepID=UPI001152ABF2|nr:HNH endonuclease [Bradyrhizobium sp. UNPF46]